MPRGQYDRSKSKRRRKAAPTADTQGNTPYAAIADELRTAADLLEIDGQAMLDDAKRARTAALTLDPEGEGVEVEAAA